MSNFLILFRIFGYLCHQHRSFRPNFLSAMRLSVSALGKSRRDAGRLAHARSSTLSVFP